MSAQSGCGGWPGTRQVNDLVCFLSLPSATRGTRNEGDLSLSLSNILKEPEEWRGKGLSSAPSQSFYPFPTPLFQPETGEVGLGHPVFYLASLSGEPLLQAPLCTATCDMNSWSVRTGRDQTVLELFGPVQPLHFATQEVHNFQTEARSPEPLIKKSEGQSLGCLAALFEGSPGCLLSSFLKSSFFNHN